MADRLSAERRSWNMSRIPSKDTSIEILVRKALFQKGFRYRKNDKRYPGKPDIVLPMYKTVVFIHGCFWHQHEGCKEAKIPKTRSEYWHEKLERNKTRDKEHYDQLHNMGWHVIILWECEINNAFNEIIDRTANQIRSYRKK